MLKLRFSQLRIIILLAVCWLWATSISASHIVGGEMTYTLKEFNYFNNTSLYAFDLILYRDQSGIDFDRHIKIGIYEEVTPGNWEVYTIIENIGLTELSFIQAPRDICTDDMLSTIEIETGVYSFNAEIPHTKNNFMVSYQKCCRNHSINNIDQPGETGAVYDVIIEGTDIANINNSPVFNEFPPTFICVNDQIEIDHSAIDLDGDELRYKFCQPFVGGGVGESTPTCCSCQTPHPSFCPPPYQNVTYNLNYSEVQPLGPNAEFKIDPLTGIITGTPNQLGSFVLAICVEEYRDGKLIGKIRRDFELNVTLCTPILEAKIEADTLIQNKFGDFVEEFYVIEVCDSKEINLVNATEKEQFVQEYEWKLFNENREIIEHLRGIDYRNISISKPELSGIDVYGYMVVNPQSSCADTAEFVVQIAEQINPSFEYIYDPCEKGSIEFVNTTPIDQEEFDWIWLFEGIQISNRKDALYRPSFTGKHEVQLICKDKQACAFDTKSLIDWNPLENYNGPTFETIDTVLCHGESLTIADQVIDTAGDYQELLVGIDSGCDSVIINYRLEFAAEPQYIEDAINICDHDSLLIDNQWVTEEGVYFESIKSKISNCDSLNRTIILTTYDTTIIIEKDTMICFGESIDFKGENYNVSGEYVYSERFENHECDSLISILNLTVTNDPVYEQIDTIICDEINLEFQGSIIQEEGIYDGYIPFSQNTCDSVYQVIFVESRKIPSIIGESFMSIDPGKEFRFELSVEGDYTHVEWIPFTGLSCNNCLNPTVKLSEDQSYLVKVYNSEDCFSIKKINIELTNNVDFYVPNIMYSRDVTNYNNVLYVQANDIIQYTYDMQVYDRYGNQIYTGSNLKCNDVTDAWRATDIDPGVFVYDIQIKQDVNPKRISGEVTILE